MNNNNSDCITAGFSYEEKGSFRVTLVYNHELSTYYAEASLFDDVEGSYSPPFVWGIIESEYPTLHPLPWLICRYVGSYEWLTPELLECVEAAAPEIAPFVSGGYSALMDYLAKAVYDNRVTEIGPKAKLRFLNKGDKQ